MRGFQWRLLNLKRHICHHQSCQPWQQLSRRWLTSGTGDHGNNEYDVIVVGGGHAGTEAACAAARLGAQTLLVTHKFETVGAMSCNPSFGGIGKGHLMKEIDALDGVCARICDLSGVQYKVLNRSRGPAVWGHRAQIDRDLYKSHIQKELLNTPNITILSASVEDLQLRETTSPESDLTKQACFGVVLGDGRRISGKSVVLTAGTFLRGTINIGLSVREAGRMGDQPAVGLARSLEEAGFTIGRLKTGTPPRLDGNTIDYSKTKLMTGDNPPEPFSFLNKEVWLKPEDQLLCHLTYTNEKVDEIIHETLHLNRHVREELKGPRFCPSLEAKILRFKGRQHRVWLEPEGFNSTVVYPNGITCTMPEEHQVRVIRCIPGLENADIVQPGYGVEYDYMDPRQLKPSLETLHIQNLFFAGQINGTTGYEEAAAQGLIAGVNAALKAQNKPPFIQNRTESYIGVLIDDLTTQGTNEPYRMFTSRAEFRLSLRPDNADCRLTAKGYHVGCVSKQRYERAEQVRQKVEEVVGQLKDIVKTRVAWNVDGLSPEKFVNKPHSAHAILKFPQVSVYNLADRLPEVFKYIQDDSSIMMKIETEVKYSVVVQSQLEDIEEVRKDETLELPEDLDYYRTNISLDAREKLIQARPATIAAATRIQGITPAAVVQLLRYVKQTKGIRTQ